MIPAPVLFAQAGAKGVFILYLSLHQQPEMVSKQQPTENQDRHMPIVCGYSLGRFVDPWPLQVVIADPFKCCPILIITCHP